MLRPRIVPCLLVHNDGLVKTVKFGDPKYVGDPINAVKIFNEKEVDEITVLDIDATVNGREPNYDMIGKLAAECRMPLCYGGGVTRVEQADRIVAMGVEKVAISAAAVEKEHLIAAMADVIGRQSVVVVIDVRKSGLLRRYEVVTRNARHRTGINPIEFAERAAGQGAGEIVINSVDRDGTLTGYDMDLVRSVREAVGTPITVLGGAGSLDDLQALVREFGIIGASAGSLFVFKGKYRAVLINYPDREAKDALVLKANEERLAS